MLSGVEAFAFVLKPWKATTLLWGSREIDHMPESFDIGRYVPALTTGT